MRRDYYSATALMIGRINRLLSEKTLDKQAQTWLPLIEKARSGKDQDFLDRCNSILLKTVPWVNSDGMSGIRGRQQAEGFVEFSNLKKTGKESSFSSYLFKSKKLKRSSWIYTEGSTDHSHSFSLPPDPQTFDLEFVTVFFWIMRPPRIFQWSDLRRCPQCDKYFYGDDRRRRFCSEICSRKSRQGRYKKADGERVKIYTQAKRLKDSGLELEAIKRSLINHYGENLVTHYFNPGRWKFLKETGN